ncbi:MAG: hypothetical protein ACOC5B_02460, partial [Myxococcota bacterium]
QQRRTAPEMSIGGHGGRPTTEHMPHTLRCYVVTLVYREPTYEAARRRGPTSYRGSFRVEARSPHDAELEARRQFEAWARRSSVSWVREVERVEVREDS